MLLEILAPLSPGLRHIPALNLCSSRSTNARQILVMLNYYVERDLQVPSPDVPLTGEETAELTPIVSILTNAAVNSQSMPPGVRLRRCRSWRKTHLNQ